MSSVSTLMTVRQGTGHLRRRIGELDGQMGDVGRALGEKVCPRYTAYSAHIADEYPETSSVGAKESSKEYGRRYRDTADLFEAAGPCTSGGGDDQRRKVLGCFAGTSLGIQSSRTARLIQLVTRRSTSSSPSVNIRHPFLRPYSILVTVPSPVDQRCRNGVDQVVAV